jgi:hypothetical protein
MTIYEEMPSISENQVVEILKWIKQEVLQIRTPFCWKNSYGRGVGEVRSECPSGTEQVGLELGACYKYCPPNYSRVFYGCDENCQPGWIDGLRCQAPGKYSYFSQGWSKSISITDRCFYQNISGQNIPGSWVTVLEMRMTRNDAVKLTMVVESVKNVVQNITQNVRQGIILMKASLDVTPAAHLSVIVETWVMQLIKLVLMVISVEKKI